MSGLLDLYGAGGDAAWLEFALRLQAAQDELFWDARAGAPAYLGIGHGLTSRTGAGCCQGCQVFRTWQSAIALVLLGGYVQHISLPTCSPVTAVQRFAMQVSTLHSFEQGDGLLLGVLLAAT